MTRAKRTPSWLAALVALGAGLATPTPASAQSPAEIQIARQTAQEGLSAYKAGEYDKAVRLFEQARAIYPSAQILRMHGYTLLALREWEKAAEAMEAALASQIGPLDEEDAKDVREQLAKAAAHLGTLTVTTRAADAELLVDGGDPIPLPMSKPLRLLEGKYKLTLRTPDHPEIVREVEIAGGTAIEIEMDPPRPEQPPPPPPPPQKPAPKADDGPRTPWFSGQRTVGFVAVGAGVAAGAAALVTALAGASLRSQVEEDVAHHEQVFGKSCEKADPRLCRFDRAVINSDADRADTLRDTSVALGIGAGVLAAGGAVLLVFYPWGEGDAPRQGRVGCGPAGGLGLSCAGTF